MDGFILEEEDLFAKIIDPNRKDLTSKFMQLAEDFLTSKRDPQNNPTVNSCLVRIPGTINSKCAQLTRQLVNREKQGKLIARTNGAVTMINESNYGVIKIWLPHLQRRCNSLWQGLFISRLRLS
jgi:hypothetical protein